MSDKKKAATGFGTRAAQDNLTGQNLNPPIVTMQPLDALESRMK